MKMFIEILGIEQARKIFPTQLHHKTLPTGVNIELINPSSDRLQLMTSDLAVPRSRTTRYGQRCFTVSGASLWNSVPLSVHDP